MEASLQTSTPSAVTLSRDRLALTLAWDASESTVLTAETARLACRCAWCTRDRILERFPERFEGVAITHIAPIGSHALHIAFSDGHARGIFPWPYLCDVAQGAVDPHRHTAKASTLPDRCGHDAAPERQDSES